MEAMDDIMMTTFDVDDQQLEQNIKPMMSHEIKGTVMDSEWRIVDVKTENSHHRAHEE